MNLFKLVILLTLVQFSYNNNKIIFCNDITGFQFCYSFPFVDSSNGKFVVNNVVGNNNYIFFYNNYMVCKYYLTKTNSTNGIYSEKMIPQYFIFKKNKKVGLLYDSSFDKQINTEIVEDILTKKYFYKTHLEIDDNFQLFQISETNANEKIVKYLTKVKRDISYPDTTIYYFSKNFTDCDFSLNNYMDSLFQSKLFKVRFIYNSSISGKLSEIIPQRELSVEKRVIKNVSENSLLNFLDGFSKSYPYY